MRVEAVRNSLIIEWRQSRLEEMNFADWPRIRLGSNPAHSQYDGCPHVLMLSSLGVRAQNFPYATRDDETGTRW